jgi:hypothetical protein
MSKLIGIVLFTVLCSLAAAVPNAWALWMPDGTALCTATGNQYPPTIVSDGSGGAIVTWYDRRSGNNDIYVQRVNASGAVQWAADGVALCTATGNQNSPTIVSDGSGGAIVTWDDYRSGLSDIYVQRVNASGAVQWTANGVALCTATGFQEFPTIVSDGSGGAIVTWQDARSGNRDIYTQRVNASGAVQWTANGGALCTATGDQYIPTIVSDGSGGAIVTWQDYRSGSPDIYVERVNASGAVQWTADGVALCTATGDQYSPTIISDGSGGAIVAWSDNRSGNDDSYAQRVNASGAVQWTADGVALCTATGDQWYPEIVSDGSGGAIATWWDNRSGNNDIYARRVDASGAVQWTADGVALCTATGNQNIPKIVTDGSGGAIVTWWDNRSGNNDIYAQRVNGSGAVQWTANGVTLCAAMGDQAAPKIVSDGSGGAIVTWLDSRNGNDDIYAQLINALGLPGSLEPVIVAVADVPGDQGGWTRICFQRSVIDDALEMRYPVSTYNMWKRIDAPALAAEAGGGLADDARVRIPETDGLSGWPIKELGARRFVSSRDFMIAGEIPSGTWELIGSFAACQLDEYLYRAVTTADSTAGGIPYSVYFVSAHTTTPSVWFASDPDSGYSVDNIPPETPGGLVAEQSFSPVGLSLSWEASTANDLSHYAVYRGLSEDFIPGPENLAATPSEPEWFDASWRWSSGYCYKISAADVHDNQSGYMLLRPEDVTGAETPKAPEASYLSQNYPNPFNPATRIVFGLSAPGYVSLRIYDAAGRLVRELVNETRAAARYEEVWDGHDGVERLVASGIYFYRLDAGSFTQTRKMILLR